MPKTFFRARLDAETDRQFQELAVAFGSPTKPAPRAHVFRLALELLHARKFPPKKSEKNSPEPS